MKRAGLLFVALASPAVLLSFGVDTAWSVALFAALASAFPIALISIGASREGRLGPLLIPLLALGVLLQVCVLAMLALRGQVLEGPWIAGLPAAAAILIYGVWLVPQLLVSLTFALAFDGFSLQQEDLDRLRAASESSDEEPSRTSESPAECRS